MKIYVTKQYTIAEGSVHKLKLNDGVDLRKYLEKLNPDSEMYIIINNYLGELELAFNNFEAEAKKKKFKEKLKKVNTKGVVEFVIKRIILFGL